MPTCSERYHSQRQAAQRPELDDLRIMRRLLTSGYPALGRAPPYEPEQPEEGVGNITCRRDLSVSIAGEGRVLRG